MKKIILILLLVALSLAHKEKHIAKNDTKEV